MQLRRSRFRVELPTVLLAVLIYAGWALLSLYWSAVPLWLLIPLGGWLIAWQGSLQHEVMHGHPTRSRVINDAIGYPPLNLWLPYPIYRVSHLRHHNDELLTDPIEDPESAYFTAEVWARFGPFMKGLMRFNATFVGRMTVGPAIMIILFLRDELRQLIANVPGHRRTWALHGLAAAAVLAWIILVAGMPLWIYALWIYVGAALTRLRSFAEHKFADLPEERTAIVENSPILGLLFLNNNLHVLHHLKPAIPWYSLPRAYAEERSALITRNGGLVYKGYRDVITRFFLKAHDDPLHPRYRGK